MVCKTNKLGYVNIRIHVSVNLSIYVRLCTHAGIYHERTYRKFESFLMVFSYCRMAAARLLPTRNPSSQRTIVGRTSWCHGRRPNLFQAA